MDEQLRKLQLTQLEMLKVVDEICRKFDIKYSLYAGTLIGAVRHKGFIPWDDDLDICMSRENYDRFIRLWNESEIKGYLLQNKENTPTFSQSFTKIRKENTTFVQAEYEAGAYHTGIFIDIFPMDRIPKGRFKQYKFYWDCMRYQLYTREFVPEQYGTLKKMVSALLLALTPHHKRMKKRERLLTKITAHNEDRSLDVVGIETVGSMKIHYSPELLDQYSEIWFEDREFMCFAGWGDHLRRKFGNYMQPPPESERTWKHHPILIDFERNYEDIAGNKD